MRLVSGTVPRTIAFILLLAGVAALGGCTAAAVLAASATAGAGIAQGQAEAFINGELKAARLVPIEVAEHATLEAMKELQATVISHKRRKYDAYIMAKAEGGPEIKVELSQKTPVVTKIETRVGVMGDQAVSRLVMSRIDSMLGIEQSLPVELSPLVAPKPPPAPAAEPSPMERSADTPPPPGSDQPPIEEKPQP